MGKNFNHKSEKTRSDQNEDHKENLRQQTDFTEFPQQIWFFLQHPLGKVSFRKQAGDSTPNSSQTPCSRSSSSSFPSTACSDGSNPADVDEVVGGCR